MPDFLVFTTILPKLLSIRILQHLHEPRVDNTEALKLEVDYFAECIENNHRPFNDGEAGLQVVKMLEAADNSL